MMVRVVIVGCKGRVGRRLVSLTVEDSELELVGAVARPASEFVGFPVGHFEPSLYASPVIVTGSISDVYNDFDVVVDFSTPQSTAQVATHAVSRGAALVCGTTGLSDNANECLKIAAMTIPIVHSVNFSPGLNVLESLVTHAAVSLPNWDAEIIEAHHSKKVDAPSGSAFFLADAVLNARRLDRSNLVFGRFGSVGPRDPREVGLHAVRLGGVIGEHQVMLSSDLERVTISHSANSRDVFAWGALAAAKWVVGRNPGIYGMKDVLFLN